MPRKISYLTFLFVIMIISGCMLVVPSCKGTADGDLYIGNWQFADTIMENDITYVTTRTLELTKTSYEETYVIRHRNDSTITAIIGTRGSIVKSRNYFTFRLEELGTCVRDSDYGCTSTLLWYGEGTQYWDYNIQFFSLSVKAELKVNETTLTLIRDLNNDGDTLDLGEEVVFTRS